MPQPTVEKFDTEIVLGAKYRDEQTKIEGIATSITFYQHACERVCIEFFNKQEELKEYMFDAPRLIRIDVKPERPTRSPRTGGTRDDHQRSHSAQR